MAGPEDNIPPPQLSTGQLLGLAQAKLDRLNQRRRRTVGITGSAVVSLLIVVAVVAIAQSRHGSTVIRTGSAQSLLAGADNTTSSLDNPPTTPATATTLPAPPVTDLPVVPATAQTTTPPTTAAPSPKETTTTLAPSTVPPDDAVQCDTSDFLVTAKSDKSNYAVGESIVITTTVKNISNRDCYPPAGGGATLVDPLGVYKQLPGQGFEVDYLVAEPWRPGATQSHDFPFNLPTCTAGTAGCPTPPFTLNAVVDWDVANPAPKATVTFQIG